MAGVSKREQWQAHVDDALIRTGQVQRAAIFGLDGKEWASSSGFQVYNSCNCVRWNILLHNNTYLFVWYK